jgi:hypothetical protein
LAPVEDSAGAGEVFAGRAQDGALGVGQTLAGFAFDQDSPVRRAAERRASFAQGEQQARVGRPGQGKRGRNAPPCLMARRRAIASGSAVRVRLRRRDISKRFGKRKP